jgi:cytochrome P450
MISTLGPANCVGRALALHELRTVISALVRRFDLEFAPDFKAEDWANQLVDKFVMLNGPLRVVLRARA